MARLNLDFEKQLVRDFVKDYLDNDIAKFKDFDFNLLNGSAKYGCDDGNFECENSNLIRAVYLLLWGNCVPDITANSLGKGKGVTVEFFEFRDKNTKKAFDRKVLEGMTLEEKETSAFFLLPRNLIVRISAF